MRKFKVPLMIKGDVATPVCRQAKRPELPTFGENDTWKPNNWSVVEEEEAAPLRRDLFGAVTAQSLPSPLPP